MNAVKATPLVIFLALAASACASGHHAAGPPMPGTVPSTRGDLAIARVQSSFWGKGFDFFPNGQTRIGCRIPGPGGQEIEGTCQTRVATNRSSRSEVVTFTESWPARKFRTHGPPKGTLHHSWRFEVRTRGSVGRPGSVVRLGGEGDLPPQSAD